MDTIILKGYALSNYINDYFVTGSTNVITFKQLDNHLPLIKLDRVDGKELYSFSQKHHMKICPVKIDLLPDHEYYVYESDISYFNSLDAEQQHEYLKTVMYNDICIGDINSSQCQQLLRPLLVTDVQYKITVQQSLETDSNWWLTSYNNIDFSMWTVNFVNKLFKTTAEVKKIKRNTRKSFYKSILEKLDLFNDTTYLISKIETEEERKKYKRSIDYIKKININGRVHIEDNKFKTERLFSVYICSYELRYYAIIGMPTKLIKTIEDHHLPLIKINKLFSKDIAIKNWITELRDILDKIPNYYKVVESMDEVLDNW